VFTYANRHEKNKKISQQQPPLSKRNATTPRLYTSAGKEKLIEIKKIKRSRRINETLEL
jgi:hypothetical protein